MGKELLNREAYHSLDEYKILWSSAPLLTDKGCQIVKKLHLD